MDVIDYDAPKEVAMTSLDWCARSRQLTLLNAILTAHFSSCAISDLERECSLVLRNAVTSGCKDAVLSLLRHVDDAFLRHPAEGDVREGPRRRLDKLLGLAVEYGHSEVAEALLQKGANPNCWYRNKPLLHLSLSLGHAHTASLLVQHGADVNMIDSKGETPIFAALSSNLEEPIIDLLTSKGAELKHQSVTGRQPIHCAALSSNARAVSRLAQAGCDVNARDRVLGDTPLHLACARCSKEAVVELIRQGARMNAGNSRGDTPLRKLLQHAARGAGKDFHQNSRLKLAGVLVAIGFRLNPVESGTSNGCTVSVQSESFPTASGNEETEEEVAQSENFPTASANEEMDEEVAKAERYEDLVSRELRNREHTKLFAADLDTSSSNGGAPSSKSDLSSIQRGRKMSKTSASFPPSSLAKTKVLLPASPRPDDHSITQTSSQEKSPFDLLIASLESSEEENGHFADDDCLFAQQSFSQSFACCDEVNSLSNDIKQSCFQNFPCDEEVNSLSSDTKKKVESGDVTSDSFLRLIESLENADSKPTGKQNGLAFHRNSHRHLRETRQSSGRFDNVDEKLIGIQSVSILQQNDEQSHRHSSENGQDYAKHKRPCYKSESTTHQRSISTEEPRCFGQLRIFKEAEAEPNLTQKECLRPRRPEQETNQTTGRTVVKPTKDAKRATKRDKVVEVMATLTKGDRRGQNGNGRHFEENGRGQMVSGRDFPGNGGGHVASLQHLCRLEVRNRLPGVRFQERVKAELELSPQMRQYLMFLPSLIDYTV